LDLDYDDRAAIEETIGDRMSPKGPDIDYNPNAIGLSCEKILGKLR